MGGEARGGRGGWGRAAGRAKGGRETGGGGAEGRAGHGNYVRGGGAGEQQKERGRKREPGGEIGGVERVGALLWGSGGRKMAGGRGRRVFG